MAVDKLFLGMAAAMLVGVGSSWASTTESLQSGYYALGGVACGKKIAPGPGGTVAFRYGNPPEGSAPFCGEHARLDGVVFKAIRHRSPRKLALKVE